MEGAEGRDGRASSPSAPGSQQAFDFYEEKTAASPMVGGAGPGRPAGPQAPGAPAARWASLDGYAKYFNVTTDEVIARVASAMLIRATFLEDLSGRTDFYGPIWMSVAFAVAIFVTNTACPLIWWHADHVPVLSSLPSALSVVLSYIGLVSVGGWATLRWFGAETVKFGELAALFSYSLVICWPVIIVSVLSVAILTWLTMVLCCAASCFFVYENILPVLRTSSIGPEKALFSSILLVIVHFSFYCIVNVAFLIHSK